MSVSMYEDKNVVGGGTGFGGGGIWAILMVFVVLWLLFKDNDRGGHGGYGHGGCNPCGGNYVPDEPSYLVDQHLTKELCHVDRDVLTQGCQTREYEAMQAEKTRGLITAYQEKNEERAYQALINQLNEKNQEVNLLRIEQNVDSRLAGLMGAIAGTNCHLDRIDATLPHVAPQYGYTYHCNPCFPEYNSGYPTVNNPK